MKGSGIQMKSEFLYEIIAGVYDLIDVIYFRNYENSPRKAVLENIESTDRILDLCTGTGTNAVCIARKYPLSRVVGVDLSKSMLRVAKRKAIKSEVQNATFYHMDATQMKCKSKRFDKVLLSLVLHEIEEPLAEAILEEAKRVLADDGEVIVTEWERSKNIGRRLLFMPIELLEPKPFKKFIKEDMHTYFERYGFEIKQYIHCDYSKVLVLRKKEVFK